ncbi:MoxR family ATPase [Rossellomorea vietnamensis]|uniref:MoxR family ATPase n=1 Tax=Rossellomorea vietnamensis TaxID=218284 RepID=A0A5D4MHB0_9BACI|nr:MoxR family ATPase [Rossellomorea vietnamensis]TYS01123.1 MoxR family ATPase [Rossellomorea vietnamensis]
MTDLAIKEQQLHEAAETYRNIKGEIGKFIVGQDETVEQVLWAVFSGGHALLEGLPGLGKTMLVRTISDVMDLQFSRIQYTPDLMPTDITGTMMIQPDEQGRQKFHFHPGPIFSNIVLADEINRATPKTQSSLLEAMQEQTVTVLGEMKRLPKPFFVLATQNPIELEGTYPLPEAQMDRFLLKINVEAPGREELKEIALRTTGVEEIVLNKQVDAEFILQTQNLAKEIVLAEHMLDYAVSLIMATSPDHESAPDIVKNNVRYGSGPRGLQSLIKVARVRALFSGRYHVSVGDLKTAALPVLRHRIFLNFEGEASGISQDAIIQEVLASVDIAGSSK